MIQRHPRTLVATATSCVLLLVLGLVGWIGVFAGGSASIGLSPVSGLPAALVSVTGQGFNKHESVDLTFDAALLRTVTTTNKGTFSTQVTIPSAALPGNHIIMATGQQSGKSAQAIFQVGQNVTPTPTPSPTLPPSPTPTLPPPPPQTTTGLCMGLTPAIPEPIPTRLFSILAMLPISASPGADQSAVR